MSAVTTTAPDGAFAWAVNAEMSETADWVVGNYVSVSPDGRLHIYGPMINQARQTFEPGSWEFAVPVLKLEKRHVDGSYTGIFWGLGRAACRCPRKWRQTDGLSSARER